MDRTSGQSGRRPLVAVVGDAGVSPDSPEAIIAGDLGRGLMDQGYRMVTGGMGGVMEAACRGARSSACWVDGNIVGILPGHDPEAANPFVDVAIPTGLDVGRNVLVAHADAVVAIGGGAGTLSEVALAWQMGRLVLAWRGGGWSGRLADAPLDGRVRYPGESGDRVHGFASVEEALALLREWLPRCRSRWAGIGRPPTR